MLSGPETAFFIETLSFFYHYSLDSKEKKETNVSLLVKIV